MRWHFKWRLKLYRDEQFLMEVGMEFHVAGELTRGKKYNNYINDNLNQYTTKLKKTWKLISIVDIIVLERLDKQLSFSSAKNICNIRIIFTEHIEISPIYTRMTKYLFTGSSVCNPGTTSQSQDFGIGILQSLDPGINRGIENLVKQPMAMDQAERQRRSYRLHRPAY